MKFIIATLLAGGTLAPAELPTPGINECAIVGTEIVRADPTLVDPTPDAVSVRLVVLCGQGVTSSSGTVRTERDLKVIDLDVEQAAVLVEAADDLLTDDYVFLSP